MTLSDINNVPKEAQILIDTNIIIYAALAHDVFGDPSRRLLKRIEMGEIYGFIPTIVVNEVLDSVYVCGTDRKWKWKKSKGRHQ